MVERVTHEELRYVWLVAAVAIVLAALPFALAALSSTPATQFSGFLIGLEDGNSYLAKMLQGAQGQWTVHLVYSTEAHAGGFVFPFYLLLGNISRLTGLSLLWVLHMARLAAIPWALYAFYRLAAFFCPRPEVRRVALVLFAFGGGFGWLWVLLGLPARQGIMPVDLWVPDASFFLSALTFPHLAFKQGLLFWFILTTLRFIDSGRRSDAAWAALSGLGCSLIHPYTVPVIGVPLGIYALWRGRKDRCWVLTGCARLALVALPSVPYVAYAWWLFRTNPVFAAWQEQSPVSSPAIHLYVIGFGIPLVLAVLGLVLRDVQFRVHPFLCIWFVVLPPLLYLPVPGQRRFLDGYQAAIALLAARGLYELFCRGSQTRASSGAAPGRCASRWLPVALMVCILSSLFLFIGATFTAAGRSEPVYRPRGEMEALDYLAREASGAAVLSSYTTGNLLPARAPVRTFLGHGAETIDVAAREQAVRDFFASGTPEESRQALLDAHGLSIVYYGPREQALGGFDPDDATYLARIYDRDGVRLYRFDRRPDQD